MAELLWNFEGFFPGFVEGSKSHELLPLHGQFITHINPEVHLFSFVSYRRENNWYICTCITFKITFTCRVRTVIGNKCLENRLVELNKGWQCCMATDLIVF